MKLHFAQKWQNLEIMPEETFSGKLPFLLLHFVELGNVSTSCIYYIFETETTNNLPPYNLFNNSEILISN